MKPTGKASPVHMWLTLPNAPLQPGHSATLHVNMYDDPDRQVAVVFTPEEAAALGCRLTDFAFRADAVTAVNAVGAVLRADRR